MCKAFGLWSYVTSSEASVTDTVQISIVHASRYTVYVLT